MSATDPQKAVGEVGVRPAQGERLTVARACGDEQAQQWRGSDLGSGKVVPSCFRHTGLLDSGCRVAGEQFIAHRRLKFAMASMGKSETKVSEVCQEFGISRQTLYRYASANGEACPDGVRVLSRRWRRTLP